MAKPGCIERCTDCFHSAAKDAVMWEAFPVPWFGNLEGNQIEVATVGLNPSWTEFVTPKKDWRRLPDRLPAVMDKGKENRGEITGEQAERIAEARSQYFTTNERTPHPWFKVLQGVMSGAKMKSAYKNGTAIHLDLVACATWQEWGKLTAAAKTTLIDNCFPKFEATIAKLPANVLLLLDGRTVFETVKVHCNAEVNIQETVGDSPGLEVWRGRLAAKYGGREFIAWSNPVGRQKNQQALVAWLRRQAL